MMQHERVGQMIVLGVEKGCDCERPVPFEIAADDAALGTPLLETLGKEAAAGVVVIEKNRIRKVCPPASRTKPSDLLEAPLLEASMGCATIPTFHSSRKNCLRRRREGSLPPGQTGQRGARDCPGPDVQAQFGLARKARRSVRRRH